MSLSHLRLWLSLLSQMRQIHIDEVKGNSCNDENTNTIRTILTREDIKEPEATQLWNLAPCSVEEAQSLIPNLKNYPDEVIEKIINEISELS